jgi:tripartite-type tricarboxylate transporter receptor subunit TctC
MMQRRSFAAAMAASFLPGLARAQASGYPSRPIKLVVPFSAGGGGDAVARLLGQALSERLHQPVLVDNRVGAGGNIGADYVLRSAPDGYTLLNLSATYAIQAAVASQLPFDPIGGLQPILMVSRDPMVVLVHASSPLRSLKDLAEAAKRAPGKLTFGSAGIGATSHLGMEELAYRLGVQLLHVPYKGSSQAFNDLLANHVDLTLSGLAHVTEFVKAGRVRALGVAALERSPALPDVPTVQEQGVSGYDVQDWKAIGGPKGIPPEIVALLNRELNAILATPAVHARFDDEGTTVVGGTPQQMMQTVRADITRWRAVAQRANIHL